MAKNKFKGVENVVKRLGRMGVGVAPSMIHAIMESALEKTLYDIKAGLSANGLSPQGYDFIRKNDAKYISKKGVAMLMGVNYDDVEAYKINWLEYGTAPRYTKDGQFRGEIVGRKIIRPLLDMNIKTIENDVEDGIAQEIFNLARENGF